MLGQAKIKQLADLALEHSRAEQTEIIIYAVESALTRFANNLVHQNVFESNATARVRVNLGKRTGVAESNDLTPEGLRRTVEIARAIAQVQAENPLTPSLPGPQPFTRVDSYVPATAQSSPEARARTVQGICRLAGARNLIAAGAYRADAYELAVVNSLGVETYHAGTIADLHASVMNEAGTASGYAASTAADVRALDAEAVGISAIDKALRSANPIALAPGDYTVVLEPAAVANVLVYLALNTFNALAVQEERSYVRGRRGELAFSPEVTLYDEGTSPDSLPLPFDHEGVPRQKVVFVDRGVIGDVVHDSATARQENRASTGHALPMPNTAGPLARHLVLAPSPSGADLLKGITRGILITRFWYTRVVHPLNVIMTGLTRDGTFLVEHGQVTLPVKNLRFTTSYVDILKNIRQVGDDPRLLRDDYYQASFRVPSVAVDGFSFTGVAQ
jgi:predicted Zn-dependent protease